MIYLAGKRYFASKSSAGIIQWFTRLPLLCVLLFSGGLAQASEALNLQPSPTLTPKDVVDFQLNALKQNSADGISATFRFASPANRKMTGPVTRFAKLFDSPQYLPMLNNQGTDIKLVRNDGSTAELIAGVVDPGGELYWYRFLLSRQSESPYENCWMTDAVMAVPHPGDSA